MRKHDVRKWLHAILDLLPVILIPVFMIYSHRHTIDSGTLEVPQNEVIDFNQLIDNVEYYDITDNVTDTGNVIIGFYPNSEYECVIGHEYLFKCRYINTNLNSNINGIRVREPFISNTYNTQIINIRGVAEISSSFDIQVMKSNDSIASMDTCDLEILQLFDLSQMFGVGNEPTTQQFNIWFPNDYYEYTLSKKVLLKNVSTITYNDTDIMSQFTYQLYNSVDKYFNVGNVFHLGEVYDWFTLNIFNGNAPIYIYVVYQIVLYELIMDLLFLLYALFMWFIDMIEKLMEKPLNSVR